MGARLLRELVECFGTLMQFAKESTFYHGINSEMLFESTYFHVYGPMSTTVDLAVAVRFARDGLVIDIRNTRAAIPMFDCQFWSDYTQENERFFIGSLQQLEFESIRHMLSGDVYDVFARVIGMMNLMIQGHP